MINLNINIKGEDIDDVLKALFFCSGEVASGSLYGAEKEDLYSFNFKLEDSNDT